MLKQIRITGENLAYARMLQMQLFPEYDAGTNYRESAEGISGNEYFLLYRDGVCVGITGIYRTAADPASAWLGWFGILPQFRRQGLGSQALRLFEAGALERGCCHARLYTDRFDNDAAIAFYEANGYRGEVYRTPEDPASLTYDILIFSKALSGAAPEPWNNRNICLTEQIGKQLRE